MGEDLNLLSFQKNKEQDSRLDNNYFEEILSSFSKATGMYMECFDTEGNTFYKPGDMKECEFCSFIRDDELGKIRCKKSYKKACREAGKWKVPYFFKCHVGFVMWAVPIIKENINVGCIICGQVLLWKADEYFIEEIMESISDVVKDVEWVNEKINKLEIISAEKCQSVAELLYLVVNYLIKRDAQLFIQDKEKDFWRKQIIIEIEERKKNHENRKFDFETYLNREKRLLQYIRVGNKEKAKKLLPAIFTDIDVLCEYDFENTKKRGIELASLISRATVEGGLDAKLAFSEMNRFHENIWKFQSQDELFVSINDFIIKSIDNVFILSENKQLSLLKNARDYINKNYYKNISVEDVSKSIFISSSYLGHLFKDNLNCTINNYITRVRIEKSIELMTRREFTIQEIAKKVGFNNQGYFTKVFKKYIGVTPINYRNTFT